MWSRSGVALGEGAGGGAMAGGFLPPGVRGVKIKAVDNYCVIVGRIRFVSEVTAKQD